MRQGENRARGNANLFGKFMSLQRSPNAELDSFCATQSSVKLCVGFYHMKPWIAFGNSSWTTTMKRRRKSGIIKKPHYLLGKVFGISHSERETSISQDFGERPEIRCNNREASGHVFDKDQTKDFASEGRHHDNAGFCKR